MVKPENIAHLHLVYHFTVPTNVCTLGNNTLYYKSYSIIVENASYNGGGFEVFLRIFKMGRRGQNDIVKFSFKMRGGV